MSTNTEIPFRELVEALLDTEQRFHSRYLYRLSDLEGDDLDALKDVWMNVPVTRRQALMEDIEELGAKDTILSFEAISRFAVEDSDPHVRLMAVRTLWEYESEDLIPLLTTLLQDDDDEQVRAAAATGLGQFVFAGELDQIPSGLQRKVEDSLLATYKGGGTELERQRALEALGYSSRSEVSTLLENTYASEDPNWVASALFAMGRSANERWNPMILAMLDNKLPLIRGAAARAAGELEISEAVIPLLANLDDVDEAVRKTCVWSLVQIGEEGVREGLEELYEKAETQDDIERLEIVIDSLALLEDLQFIPLFDFPKNGDNLEDDAELLEDGDDFID